MTKINEQTQDESADQFNQLLQFFKALGNETRLRIVGLLASQERSVGELAELLELTEPTVSHHLSMMKSLGLVTMQAEGTVRIYSLDTTFLHSMSKDIFSQGNLASLVSKDVEETWEEKTLRSILDGDTIRAIPSREKKKLVLLRWLVEKFEFGVQYHELELNELLKKYHSDCAALRRHLVEYGFMKRERNVYWRVEEVEELKS
ncbi:MAG: metalloregulator ArsR/SmtB family transcription factor [Chloroflexota bacterium]